MSRPRPQRGTPGLYGGFLDDADNPAPTPIPARREHPPKVWGTLAIEGDELVVRLAGWRVVVAMKRRLAVPLSAIVSVAHDPAARSHVQAKLRRKAGRTGIFRVGTYHSLVGWSFWSVGMGRNAVVVEASGARYRYLVVEVADPTATVEEISKAAGFTSEAPASWPPPAGPPGPPEQPPK